MARYEVYDSETFAGQRKLLLKTVPRLDEALKGLEWALARKPFIFDKIEQVNGLRLARLEALPIPNSNETNAARVYFRLLEGNRVELQWIEVFSSSGD